VADSDEARRRCFAAAEMRYVHLKATGFEELKTAPSGSAHAAGALERHASSAGGHLPHFKAPRAAVHKPKDKHTRRGEVVAARGQLSGCHLYAHDAVSQSARFQHWREQSRLPSVTPSIPALLCHHRSAVPLHRHQPAPVCVLPLSRHP
jgi:hypothetical protein